MNFLKITSSFNKRYHIKLIFMISFITLGFIGLIYRVMQNNVLLDSVNIILPESLKHNKVLNLLSHTLLGRWNLGPSYETLILVLMLTYLTLIFLILGMKYIKWLTIPCMLVLVYVFKDIWYVVLSDYNIINIIDLFKKLGISLEKKPCYLTDPEIRKIIIEDWAAFVQNSRLNSLHIKNPISIDMLFDAIKHKLYTSSDEVTLTLNEYYDKNVILITHEEWLYEKLSYLEKCNIIINNNPLTCFVIKTITVTTVIVGSSYMTYYGGIIILNKAWDVLFGSKVEVIAEALKETHDLNKSSIQMHKNLTDSIESQSLQFNDFSKSIIEIKNKVNVIEKEQIQLIEITSEIYNKIFPQFLKSHENNLSLHQSNLNEFKKIEEAFNKNTDLAENARIRLIESISKGIDKNAFDIFVNDLNKKLENNNIQTNKINSDIVELKNNYIKDKDLSLFINDLNVKFKDIENTIENNNNILNNKSVTYDENFNDIRNIFIEADRRIISINQSLSTTTQDVNYLGDKVDNLTEVVKKITSTLI